MLFFMASYPLDLENHIIGFENTKTSVEKN